MTSHGVRCFLLAAAPLLTMSFAPEAVAGGLTPAEARDRMVVPEGFRVEVFASEPEIRQPVAACFDERGRMWVIEYLQYPTPAGLVPVKVDQYLRTEYDRVPEPPPKGVNRGADRIKILEDTDGDGKADKVTTFAEGLNLASGLAVGYGGVFVGQAPYLLFYPDKNRDDRPDGDPEVLLSGFGLQDAHATVNSLTWGPDGWLYGAQGSTVTAKIRGVEFQQGIWRYHPKTRKFELFSEGGGNTWGVDFDRGGRLFGSSNGGFVAFHMEQGGYSWKGFAKHGPLHNPRTYGYFNSIEFKGPKPGGHVTPGGIIYKGDNFPEEMRGAFLGGNLLSNTVYWYKLSPKGSTFSMKFGGTLIDAKDPWFRPIDLLTGPDGSVFVVDWYDKRASHLDPRDTWDKTNGRIYKLSYGKPNHPGKFDLAKLSDEDLLRKIDNPNDWWFETALRIFYERGGGSLANALHWDDRPRLNTTILDLRHLWLLNAGGRLDDGWAMVLLRSGEPEIRRGTLRLLADHSVFSADLERLLRALAARGSDSTVRAQMAANCQRWGAQTSLPILKELISMDLDTADEHVPLMIWWAIEKCLRESPDGTMDLVRQLEESPDRRSTLYDGFLRERIARALAEEGTEGSLAKFATLLGSDRKGDSKETLYAGMEKGLQGRRFDAVPPSLAPALERAWSSGTPSLALVKLSARLGLEPARSRAAALAIDSKTGAAERVALCELLGQTARPADRAALSEILAKASEPSVQMAAINALGGYPDPAIARDFVARYASWPEPLRDRAREHLCGRKAWAAVLLDAIESGTISAKELRTPQVVQIVALGDPALTARLEAAWGRIPGRNSAEKTRRIAEVRGILPEGDKGNPLRGAVVFKNTCAACHRLFGDGERIGPELTGSERGDLDFLLTSLVDPSAVIRKEYEGQTIALKDGRVLTGLIVEEDGKSLTLFDGQKQRTTVAKSDIEEKKAAAVSVMPEGLLDALSEAQVRDLFRYLQSGGPVAAK